RAAGGGGRRGGGPAPEGWRQKDKRAGAPRGRPSPGRVWGKGGAGQGGASRDLQGQAWHGALAHRAGDGSLPSGSEIARQYGRHERWGRLVKQAGAAGEFDDGEFSEPGLHLVQPATPSAAPE